MSSSNQGLSERVVKTRALIEDWLNQNGSISFTWTGDYTTTFSNGYTVHWNSNCLDWDNAQFRLSFYKLYYRTEQTKYIMQLPDGNWTCDKPPSVFKNYNRRKRAHL
jgi:hypothetical protein